MSEVKQQPLSWVDEAFKNIGLREVKGPKHNPTIVGWLKRLGAWWKDDEAAWCFGPETEVLTDKGFIRFDELKNEKPTAVAQFNPHSRRVEYVSDFNIIEKDYSGNVYCNARLGFICDPNHHFYGRWSGTGPERLRPIHSITTCGVNIPNIRAGEEEYKITDSELVFLAAFLSDGYYKKDHDTRVKFKFSKQRKIQIIEQYPILSSGDEKPRENRQPTKWFSFDIKLLRRDVLSEYKLMDWEFIRNLSARQCKVFIDAYAMFDGTGDGNVAYEVFTSDERLRDQLCFIAAMAGYKATPFSTKQVSPNTKIEYLHNVYVSPRLRRSMSPEHLYISEYTGKLYCLQVPTMIMVIRTKSGVIIPVGNCGTYVAHCLTAVGRGSIPKHWYRALEYLKWGTALDKPAYGSVGVLKRKGGGHVFFVVGVTEKGDIVGLGGNQGDEVNLRVFSRSVIEGYRWPPHANGALSMPYPDRYDLPVYNSKTLKVVGSMA